MRKGVRVQVSEKSGFGEVANLNSASYVGDSLGFLLPELSRGSTRLFRRELSRGSIGLLASGVKSGVLLPFTSGVKSGIHWASSVQR